MHIYLRPVKEEDGKLIVKWRNTPSVMAHCFNKKTITLESNMAFFRQYIETGVYKQFIVEKAEEFVGVAAYPIATVYLKDIDYNNKRCELCVFTSDDEEWNSDSQSIAIRKLLEYCFRELHIHKVYSYVFAEFEDEIELLRSAGFEKEALLKSEAVDMSGNYADAYRMSVFNTEEMRQK